MVDKFATAARQALDQNQTTNAITAYENGIQINPNNEEIMDELSRLYFRVKNFAASQVYIQKLVIKHPKNVHFLNLQGYNAWKLHNFSEAIEAFQKSLQILPNQVTLVQDLEQLNEEARTAYFEEAAQLIQQKQYEQALDRFRKILITNPGEPPSNSRIA